MNRKESPSDDSPSKRGWLCIIVSARPTLSHSLFEDTPLVVVCERGLIQWKLIRWWLTKDRWPLSARSHNVWQVLYLEEINIKSPSRHQCPARRRVTVWLIWDIPLREALVYVCIYIRNSNGFNRSVLWRVFYAPLLTAAIYLGKRPSIYLSHRYISPEKNSFVL